MDRSTQIENIQKDVNNIKKENPELFGTAKESVKAYLSAHPELKEDTELQLVLLDAVGRLGKETVDDIINNHFRESKGGLEAKLSKGTSKPSLSFLYSKLTGRLERAGRSHKVYVLTKTPVREGVKWPSEEDKIDPETGKQPEHTQFSVSLWDDGQKEIISLFLTDRNMAMLQAHTKLEPNHAYAMQMGNKNEETGQWYPATDPGIIELNGNSFTPDWNAMAEYVMNRYPHVEEPYANLIELQKKDPSARVVMMAGFTKKPSYIELTPSDEENNSSGSIIGMFHSEATQSLPDEGKMVVVGKLSKYKPKKEGGPEIMNYTISFPEVILLIVDNGEKAVPASLQPDTSSGDNGSPKSSNNNGQKPAKDTGEDADLDNLLG